MTDFFAWISVAYTLTTPTIVVDFQTKEACTIFARGVEHHAGAQVTCFDRRSGLIVYDTKGRTSGEPVRIVPGP